MSLVNGSWTLVFEVFFYCLLLACMLFTRGVRAVLLVGLLLAGLASVGSLARVSSSGWNVVFNPILMEFVTGVVVALIYARAPRMRFVGPALFFPGILLAFWLSSHDPGAASGMQMILASQNVALRVETWGLAATLIVSGVILGDLQIRGAAGSMFTALGNASYSAYLLEMYPIVYGFAIARRLVRPEGLKSLWFVIGVAVVCTVLTQVLGWISYQWVEWPLLRKLQRRYIQRQAIETGT